MPDFRTVATSTFSADELSCKDICTAVPAFLPASPFYLILNCFVYLRCDDCRVTFLNIILRYLTGILFDFLGEIVGSESLLQQCISLVLFVCKNTADCGGRPFCFSCRSWNAVSSQLFRNGIRCRTCKKKAVYPSAHKTFFRS